MAQENPLPSGNNRQPTFFVGGVLLKFWSFVIIVLSQIRQRVIQTFTVFFLVFLLLWIAAFLYGSLYYSYMPNTAFSTNVYYYYRLVFCLSVQEKLRVSLNVQLLSAAEQTVNRLHLFGALIPWLMSPWSETRNTYVLHSGV